MTRKCQTREIAEGELILILVIKTNYIEKILKMNIVHNYIVFMEDLSTNGGGIKKRNAYRILVGKPEGKRPLGRPRR
jgi:hypothetical protein